MFTSETICESIHEIKAQPMTPERVHVLADLLYIKEHCGELSAGGEKTLDLMAWVDHMQNADGTTGPRWSMGEAAAIQTQYGISCGTSEFYAALNMMYSDYGLVLPNNVELYAHMAQAFLTDPDAQPHKLERYYRYIARHA